MGRIQELIGRECDADGVNRALRDFARGQRAAAVGAVHVTCSDECEREAVESFQHWFADAVLPELKFWSKSPFRTANLGGRYEWGAIRVAENHYALPQTQGSFKLMVVKVNSHVGVLDEEGQRLFGRMDRYATASTCCGALHAMMAGRRLPALDELAAAFHFDDVPRLEMLRSADVVSPDVRSLVVAVVNARLQARSAVVDIQDYSPKTPTVSVVVPTVTLNRKQRDTEFIVGMYWTDSRKGGADYVGLGDDPSRYHIRTDHGYLLIEDAECKEPREARNHRQDVVQQWRARHPKFELARNARLDEIAEKSKNASHASAEITRETLKTLLWLVADVSPIPLAILLFAKGLAGVHHLYRVHRLARGADGGRHARDIIGEVSDQLTHVPADRARDTIDAVMAHYG
ncbi:MAG: hypothetical protein FJ276_13915 [Planctomycetes bacterium]|nr:hypothetical protein [Planctomycetota bacterium]